ALDGAPGIVLGNAVLRLFGRMPADGGRVEQDLGTAECGDAGRFGIPLVPADERRDASVAGIEAAKTEVSGSEIVFLEVQRVIWDVHLAVFAKEGAIGIEDEGG